MLKFTTIISLLSILIILIANKVHAYGHVENFNSYVTEESKAFFKNIFNGQGIVDNFKKIGDSLQTWKDTISGTRCANPAECKNRRTPKLIQKEPSEEFDELSPIEKEIKNIHTQLEKLSEFENALNSLPFDEHIIKDNRENVLKYRTSLLSSIQHHTERRYLQNSGVVDEDYKLYEGPEDGDYLIWIQD